MDEDTKKAWIRQLLFDLNINFTFADVFSKSLLLFFDRLSQPTKGKNGGKSKQPKITDKTNVLSVFDNYSVADRDQLVTHFVYGRLYVILYYTFFGLYLEETKEEFKDMVTTELLNVMDKCLHSCVRAGPYGAEISMKD